MTEQSVCQLTKTATDVVKNIMKKENLDEKETYLRIEVVGMSCSGPQYSLDFTDSIDEKSDQIFEQDGIKIAADSVSAQHLTGTTINYVDDLNGSGFKFENPNYCGGCTTC